MLLFLVNWYVLLSISLTTVPASSLFIAVVCVCATTNSSSQGVGKAQTGLTSCKICAEMKDTTFFK